MSGIHISVGDKQVVPIDAVTPYPGNARTHATYLDTSLAYHGQYRSIVVQRSTGHILAGNGTWEAMRNQGAEHVSVEYVDVDDEQARRIVLIDNKTADDASYDNRMLAELLAELPDLDATGYDPGELERLEQDVTPPDLDDLAAEIGEPKTDDGWPTIHARVPHHVMAAWNDHLSSHSKNAAHAMASLLGIDVSTIDDAA